MRCHSIVPLAGLGLVMLNGVLSQPVIFGYVELWSPLSLEMDFSKYTHINLAFVTPKEDASFKFEGDDGGKSIENLVGKIHEKGSKAQVSLGGWLGSANLSSIVKDEGLRKKFEDNIVNLVKEKNLDGIDIDWEYPGRNGSACNVVDKENDTNNYRTFLESLRKRFNTEFGEGNKLITLAVHTLPFFGPDGQLPDVSDFANQVDFALLMQYDMNGAWANTTGPNAPLEFEQGKGQQISFASAIEAWTNAKWPKEKLVCGLAFYGHSFELKEEVQGTPPDQYQPHTGVVPFGDKDDGFSIEPCTDKNATSGTWRWRNLRAPNGQDQAVLPDPDKASEPWLRQVDKITETPSLFNSKSRVFIVYDDKESIKAKTLFAKEKGVAGMMIWSITMDTNDSELTNVIKENWP